MDQKDLLLHRLLLRANLLERFLERLVVALPKQDAIAALREIQQDLSAREQWTFPNLDPAMADLAASETEEEIAYLMRFSSSVAVKVFRPDE